MTPNLKIFNLLRHLGVTEYYVGFFYASYAVQLVIQQPERLLRVTKWLYPDVAKQYGTNWKAVERNIRTVSDIIWKENRPLLEELAQEHLMKKPQNNHLLAILSASLEPALLEVHSTGSKHFMC